jgi:hypothetical protein
MTLRLVFVIGVAITAMAAGLQAQTTTPSGAAQVTTEQMTGEVMLVEGNLLLAKMQPSGTYRVFNVQPRRQFIIDGRAKLIGDLKPGTVLNATVTTTTQPVTVRTTTVTNGTVWYVSGNYVILTLANGENRDYKVPESFRFTVEGKPASVSDLRKGMKVSATRIVEEPRTEMSTQAAVTGKAPK